MKKKLINFAENIISKEQMSKIKGGCGGDGSCSASLDCGNSQITCNSLQGNCQTSHSSETVPWIKCDGIEYKCG
jgi:hypothetical protein